MPPLNSNREVWLAERVKELEAELAKLNGQNQQSNEQKVEKRPEVVSRRVDPITSVDIPPSPEYYNAGLPRNENE